MLQAASVAAAAAVAALQQPSGPEACGAVSSLLRPAQYCSITLSCGGGAALCSGNLAAGFCQASLVSGSTLAGACISEKKCKLFKTGGQHAASKRGLEDVRLIAEGSGCSTILCLPLLASDPVKGSCSAAGATCLGALTVGFASAADMSGPALQSAMLLVHALTQEQQQPLMDLSHLVSSMLLLQPLGPGSRPAAEGEAADGEGYSDFDLDGQWDLSGSDGEGREGVEAHSEGEDGRPAGANGMLLPPQQGGATAAGLAAGGGCGERPHPQRLLAFVDGSLERRYAGYHAAQMLRVDACAYLICFCFFCMEAFVPGTPFCLAKRMGWRCLLGLPGLLPGLLLSTTRTRTWFVAHRDLLLLLTWTYITTWMTTICNYMNILDAAAFRNPLYLQSFGWLTVVGLAFQMRFRFQLIVAPLAYAVNTQLLPSICTKFYNEQPPSRCLVEGLLKALLHGVLLPLACCYVFEGHMRRLFVNASLAGSGGGGGGSSRGGSRRQSWFTARRFLN